MFIQEGCISGQSLHLAPFGDLMASGNLRRPRTRTLEEVIPNSYKEVHCKAQNPEQTIAGPSPSLPMSFHIP